MKHTHKRNHAKAACGKGEVRIKRKPDFVDSQGVLLGNLTNMGFSST
jgi:hypothetical protein